LPPTSSAGQRRQDRLIEDLALAGRAVRPLPHHGGGEDLAEQPETLHDAAGPGALGAQGRQSQQADVGAGGGERDHHRRPDAEPAIARAIEGGLGGQIVDAREADDLAAADSLA
jgi:hypothetical protein